MEGVKLGAGEYRMIGDKFVRIRSIKTTTHSDAQRRHAKNRQAKKSRRAQRSK